MYSDAWFDIFSIKIFMHARVIKKQWITIKNRILVYANVHISFHDANSDAVKIKLQCFDNCEIRTLYFIDVKIEIDDKKTEMCNIK